MPRKQEKIKTRAWVHKGGELVDVDTLSPEDREEVATQLCLGLLGALFAGKAEFRRAGDGIPDDGRTWEPVELPDGFKHSQQEGDTKDEPNTVPALPG